MIIASVLLIDLFLSLDANIFCKSPSLLVVFWILKLNSARDWSILYTISSSDILNSIWISFMTLTAAVAVKHKTGVPGENFSIV